MKIARMEFRSMGLFRSLEIHGLSPGLNIIIGPTGSGKTTIRRAIGGMFFGFDRTGADTLFPSKGIDSSGELEVEIQGANYLLSRKDQLLDRTVDLVRKSSSGSARLPVSSGLGALSASDYFTFFNLSLIDSPEIHRRMVHALKTSSLLVSGSSYWKSKADYLQWRHDAEVRRNELSDLEIRLRDAQIQRQKLNEQLLTSKESYQYRLRELEERIASLSALISDLKNRHSLLQDELRQKEERVEWLRHQIRNAPQETVVRKPAVVSQRLVDLYKMLDEVQARIGRIRSVQKDLSNRKSELRDARTDSTDEPNRIAELELKTVRKTIVQLEDRIDHLNAALKEAAILDQNDRHLEHSTKEMLAQAKDDLYCLCQDLSHHQQHLARGRMNAENRDLKRCWTELKRQLAWLKIRRKAVLTEIRNLDPSGYQLIVRGRRPFCNCASHHGHLEARRQFLEEEVTEVQPGVDTSGWQSELDQLLVRCQEIRVGIQNSLDQIAAKDLELQEAIAQKNHLLSGRDHLLEDRIASIESEILSLENRIAELRILVDKDQPLWDLKYDNLMDRASDWLLKISAGKLRDLFLDEAAEKLVANHEHSGRTTFENLGRSDQDQVCLAVCLAVAQRVASTGHYVPLVIDDLFVNLDDTRSKATRNVLREFVERGHQILLFAAHRQLNDRYVSYSPERLAGDSIAVFELPNLSVDLDNIRWPIVLHPGAGLKPVVAAKPVVKPEFSGVIDEQTLLSVIDLVEPEYIPVMTEHGIITVGDLLDMDPDLIDAKLENRGIDQELLRRWQNQSWLCCCIPGLRVYDSRLLVGSGITEPEILESLSSHEVLERLEGFLSTTRGKRVMNSGSQYELNRVNRWMSSLRDNPSAWRSGRKSWRSRSRRNRSEFGSRSSNSSRSSNNRQSESTRRDRSHSSSTSRSYSSNRINGQRNSVRSEGASDSLLRKVFYLSLNDEVEKAPSIGNRMAEKLAAVEVLVVSQLLEADPAILATKLDDRRLDEQTILAWQNQAKLVCQIPNLRGHDAQMLVACDFLTPESVAESDPAKIFAAVVPFAESKQGQKILRSSKKPDMDEINDWILWAQNSRPLSMAVA